MRIGIDARFYGPQAKGLGRYCQELLGQLQLLDKKNQYVVFLRREDFTEVEFVAPNFRKVLADWRPYSPGEQLFFPWLIWRNQVDLMHFTHFNAPYFWRGPLVVTIHDLILKKFPTRRSGIFAGFKYKIKNIFYHLCLRSVARRARKIITVSHYTKSDLVKILKTPPSKIEVIYEGATFLPRPSQKPAEREIVLRKYGLQKPYALYVGNAYPHKNLPFLLRSFAQLLQVKQSPFLQLALVGKKDDFYRRIEQNFHATCQAAPQKQAKFCASVMFTGFVPDRELAVLYSEAFVYVFPSLCEGFGFPGLEAMAFDVPVLAAAASCLPEIFGPAALYFDPRNQADFLRQLKALLADQFLRQKLISLGRRQIKKFTWSPAARTTLKIYTKAAL